MHSGAKRWLLAAIAVSVTVSLFSAHFNRYYLGVAIDIGINVILAVSLNLINGHGADVGPALVGHKDIRLISFTGSTETGRVIAEQCARENKIVSLEMGGKNAIIVMDDADVDNAVEGSLWGAFGTSGQRCTASSRLVVHKKVYKQFVTKLVERAKSLRVGNGLDPKTEVGPVIHEDAMQKILGYVHIGKNIDKATLACGGNRMTKGDLAKKQEAERLEWRRRGILGVITALKPDTKEITISNRTMAGTQSIVIPISDKTEMRRYAPDSIKFGDAKPSSFDELKVGDQLRALGDRTEDPLRFNPQKVVTGSFRTVGGVVTAVDPETGEIKINELEKKKTQ